jgi:Fis family transcriptional regulator
MPRGVRTTARRPPAQPPAQLSAVAAAVTSAINDYLESLDGHASSGLYDLVLHEIEPPLLRLVLAYTDGNRSRAARLLGLSRETLRKKLAEYDLG